MQREDETREQLLAERDRLRQQVAGLTETLHSREHEIQALLGITPHPVIARFDRQLRHTYVNAAVKMAFHRPNREVQKTTEVFGFHAVQSRRIAVAASRIPALGVTS